MWYKSGEGSADLPERECVRTAFSSIYQCDCAFNLIRRSLSHASTSPPSHLCTIPRRFQEAVTVSSFESLSKRKYRLCDAFSVRLSRNSAPRYVMWSCESQTARCRYSRRSISFSLAAAFVVSQVAPCLSSLHHFGDWLPTRTAPFRNQASLFIKRPHSDLPLTSSAA